MATSNTFSSYGSVTKTFHWSIALLILTALPLGLIATRMALAINDPNIISSDADIALTARLFSLHKTIGVTVFFLALARILWALSQTKPGLLNADHKPEAFAAEAVHWLLYGSLVLVPLSGWIHHAATEGFAPILWPFGQSLPLVPKSASFAELMANLHWLFMITLVGALVLHIAGALKHHFVDHDGTLRRMLPGQSDTPTPPAQVHTATPAFAALGVWALVMLGGWSFGLFAHHPAEGASSAQLAAVQSDWQVQEGEISITITQLGSPVTGRFADWTAAIAFEDPDAPGPAGSAEVNIAIGSLTIGTVTDQAMGADFFDLAQFPTAEFKAELFKTETGYEARGPLTIRDKSLDIVLPFTLDMQDGIATVAGAVEIDRLAFDVGISQPTEGSLAFAVTIEIALTAQRAQ